MYVGVLFVMFVEAVAFLTLPLVAIFALTR